MIGERVKVFRVKKGLSQEYLANRLNLSQSTLARIESGKAKLDASLIPSVCEELEISMEELFSTGRVLIENNTFNNSSNAYVERIVMAKDASLVNRIELLENEIFQLSKQLSALLDIMEKRN